MITQIEQDLTRLPSKEHLGWQCRQGSHWPIESPLLLLCDLPLYSKCNLPLQDIYIVLEHNIISTRPNGMHTIGMYT